jgi:SAM-dependent methyltransferase
MASLPVTGNFSSTGMNDLSNPEVVTGTNHAQDDDPYGNGAAAAYDHHHRSSLRNRLTNRRELAVLGQALKHAGPDLDALDLPCGAGRFWPVFAEAQVASLIAGDVSEGMLQVAQANRLSGNFPCELVCTSAFDIDLPDQSVDFVACMRFLHHLALPMDRLLVLRQLRRVTRRFVAITLWVDGNLGAQRRMRRQVIKPTAGFGRRICRPRTEVESEFRQAGFKIVDHFDVWPKLSMWRLYLLERDDV